MVDLVETSDKPMHYTPAKQLAAMVEAIALCDEVTEGEWNDIHYFYEKLRREIDKQHRRNAMDRNTITS